MNPPKKWLPVLLIVASLAGAAILAPAVVERVAYATAKGTNQADRSELLELSRHDQLSMLFRAVAKTVKPAVVEVRVTKMARVPDLDELFKHFFEEDNFPFRFRVPQPREPKRRFRKVRK